MLKRLSAMPWLSLAMVLAVAGAKRRMSAQRASSMWLMDCSLSGSKRAVRTRSPLNACKVVGLMKCVAFLLKTQRT